MRVALIVPGGVDRTGEYRVIPCLLWLIERLARNHEVHVFALRQEPDPCRYELLGATIHNIGIRHGLAYALATIVGEHRRIAFDLFHAFWVKPPGLLAVAAGRIFRRPVVVHIAGGELVAIPGIPYGGRQTWKGRVAVRIALKGASRVTAASTPIQEASQALGVTAHHLPFGVDLARWPVLAPRRRTDDRPARLIHIASLNWVKDQRTLLEAVAALVRQRVPFHLDIVGGDTLGGEVQRIAGTLNLSQHVTFHGFLPHGQLRPLVEAADLHVMSSRHEAGPVAVLESAVAGVPTVGTAVGHIRDWEPDAAVAVPVGDSEALAAGMQELLTDEVRRLDIAAAAQRRAVEEDADWTADRVEGVYRDLVGTAEETG